MDRKSNRVTPAPYAVIFGGVGRERSISCLSAGSFISTAKALGYNVLQIGIHPCGEFYIYQGDVERIFDGSWVDDQSRLVPTFPVRLGDTRGFLTRGEIIEVLGAVPVLHGEFGEDGRVQGALECAGISYAGCDTLCGALCADKAYCKAVASSLGIPVLEYRVLEGGEVPCGDLPCDYPLFVKPCRSGSSIGASIVRKESELAAAVSLADDNSDGRVIVERALSEKTELECAFLDADGLKIVTPPGQITTERGFYDYSAKYAGGARVLTRASVENAVAEKIREYTGCLAKALSVRHLSRFDYFLSPSGEIYFNEVNTFPGLTSSSLYAAMLEECGVPFRRLVAALLSESRGGLSVW